MAIKPTYLYVKTHLKTGLKYFGKTTQDPFKYSGSGVHWRRHLKIHGNEHSTTIIGLFTDENDLKEASLRFSQENSIVESDEWANLKEEDGMMGGATRTGYIMTESEKEHLRQVNLGRTFSVESRKKISEANKRRAFKIATTNRGRPCSEETKIKISNSLKGNRIPSEIREKISKTLTGRKKSEETKEKLRQNWKNQYASNAG